MMPLLHQFTNGFDGKRFSKKLLCSASLVRSFSSDKEGNFLPHLDHSRLKITMTAGSGQVPAKESLVFGHCFSDHMLQVDWEDSRGWSDPQIVPYGPLSLYPSASVLNYGTGVFEGLKAYKLDKDSPVRLFRPLMNMERMLRSSRRLALPFFEPKELLELIKELVRVDSRWIPEGIGYSLYIRPLLFGTHQHLGVNRPLKASMYVICSPVGPYYTRVGFSAIKLIAEEHYVRAWPGGVGNCKVIGNYAPGILPAIEASEKHGADQILWLLGSDYRLTEVGTMNLFVFWKTPGGNKQLITPALADGTILPGVVRDSILHLTRQWGEFEVIETSITISELLEALKHDRLLEVFGSGTAAIITPVHSIRWQGKDYTIPLDTSDPKQGAGPLARRLWKSLVEIQYGQVAHSWSIQL